MTSASRTCCLTPSDGYRLWAPTYDREPNPMLSLEQRTLTPLLPPLAGLDIVDLGCGTGRWLYALQGSGARCLLGVDSSQEMLSQARAKLGDSVRLICADCANAPIPRASADVVFCSFVLSYVDDPGRFLRFVRTVLRPDGFAFLTDVHPETAAALNWRRGVRVQDEFQEIRTHHRTLADVISLCWRANLKVAFHLEPPFEEEERIIFEASGRREHFQQIGNRPAIYVLQLSPAAKRTISGQRKKKPGNVSLLREARFAFGPSETVCGDMLISGSRVESIGDAAGPGPSSPAEESGVDLRGYLVLPGLINAHDHLEFALFPRLGKGNYKNFLEWAEDIQHSRASEIALQRRVPKHIRLWWGGIRNLLCGVTTVCHHNPYESVVFSDDFVIRVLKGYGWAHSLVLEPGAAHRKENTPEGQPFFIHLAEGIDEQSRREIFELDRAGALDASTVVIHGLGLDEEGGALLRSAGAGLIWCPSSNLFLFGKSMSRDEIRRFSRVALGSDSPLTAQGDLLDEVRCAHQILQTPAADLYEHVTQQAARLLALQNREGSLRIGGVADLIAVRDTGLTPAETLVDLSYWDVELVLLGGRVQLASSEMMKRLPPGACEGLQPLMVEGIPRWIRAPLDRMFRETAAHLHGDIYLGGKQVSLGK